MKTSTVIRFVLAAVFATLACGGMLANVVGSCVLFSVYWLLMTGKKELTRPIPRNEWFGSFMLIGIFLAVMLTGAVLPIFLHRPYVYEYHHQKLGIGGSLAVLAMWVLSMWGIHRRWQMEKANIEP